MNKKSQHIHQYKWLVLFPVFTMLNLTGCVTDRVSKAEMEMEAIRKSPAGTIEEPPKPAKVKDFVYTANNKLSPFIAPSSLNIQKQIEEEVSDIQPDVTREKEEMEQFDIKALIYRGLITAPNGEEFGLVERPDGMVASVKVGDHMGMNYGRIVEMTPTQINLIEIVPGERSGFVEKPQSLVSPD